MKVSNIMKKVSTLKLKDTAELNHRVSMHTLNEIGWWIKARWVHAIGKT
jgi:hypothetical protein